MIRGFKNFLTRGDVVVIAIGLVVATAFSTLIKAFTDSVINPIIARAQGDSSSTQGLGVQLGHATATNPSPATFLNVGAFLSAVVYFIIFMAVVYFVLVVPYKHVQAKRGVTVFGDQAAVKKCPACLSDDLPAAATKCRYCGTEQPATEDAS